MSGKGSSTFILAVGFMLFALFFGAGNLIFPVLLGQMAGEHVWAANAGFVVTGVGLPLLSILAFAFSGKSDLQALASRVNPVFGVIFTVALYLSIGAAFAIPRNGTVYFEIGIKPFLGDGSTTLPLFFPLSFSGLPYFSL